MPVATVLTHCPCGMSPREAEGRMEVESRDFPDDPGRSVPEGMDVGGATDFCRQVDNADGQGGKVVAR